MSGPRSCLIIVGVFDVYPKSKRGSKREVSYQSAGGAHPTEKGRQYGSKGRDELNSQLREDNNGCRWGAGATMERTMGDPGGPRRPTRGEDTVTPRAHLPPATNYLAQRINYSNDP